MLSFPLFPFVAKPDHPAITHSHSTSPEALLGSACPPLSHSLGWAPRHALLSVTWIAVTVFSSLLPHEFSQEADSVWDV